MPVGVIHSLEMIHIEHDHCHGITGTCRVPVQVCCPFEKATSGVQPGQLVAFGQFTVAAHEVEQVQIHVHPAQQLLERRLLRDIGFLDARRGNQLS